MENKEDKSTTQKLAYQKLVEKNDQKFVDFIGRQVMIIFEGVHGVGKTTLVEKLSRVIYTHIEENFLKDLKDAKWLEMDEDERKAFVNEHEFNWIEDWSKRVDAATKLKKKFIVSDRSLITKLVYPRGDSPDRSVFLQYMNLFMKFPAGFFHEAETTNNALQEFATSAINKGVFPKGAIYSNYRHACANSFVLKFAQFCEDGGIPVYNFSGVPTIVIKFVVPEEDADMIKERVRERLTPTRTALNEGDMEFWDKVNDAYRSLPVGKEVGSAEEAAKVLETLSRNWEDAALLACGHRLLINPSQ